MLAIIVGFKLLGIIVLGIGPRHVPHEFNMQVGGVALDKALELYEIAIGRGQSRVVAGLLEGDDVPLLVADNGLEVDILGVGTDATHHLTVFVVGLAREQVVVVAVNAATTDIGIADDERVALCGSELVELLFDGILREAVADGQHLDDLRLRPYGAQ